MPNSNHLIVILGTTASGKTRLAVELAQQLHGEIISADSRQVYKGLDIGSGKDLAEYQDVPYHLIDIVEPGIEYNIFQFQQDFIKAFNSIKDNQKLPIMAGGSALYVDSILKGYRLIEVPENPALRQELSAYEHEDLVARLLKVKPEQHNTTDLIDKDRVIRAIEIAEGEIDLKDKQDEFPDISPTIFAIDWPREVVKKRITERLKQRFSEGMIEEVQQLHQQGVSWQTLHFYGLEYRFIAEYLQGNQSYNDMNQKLNSAIHQFAKKQLTWLRRLERNGFTIHWLAGSQPLLPQAMQVLLNNQK